jgi:serine/threonine-protein kinase HipA
MPLHLVGETLDKARGHYRAGTGRLVQLHRGIYVDAGDDIGATVLKHAVRIAKYLYPKAYLSAASAVTLGPTRDGRLFLSGRRKQRTHIRTLEIIQNEAPKHPSLGSAVVNDGMGEFRVDVSSVRQRFLEAFRLRSEHAASIDDAMRAAIAGRLIEEYGNAREAANAVLTFARENEWYREGERAERFLLNRPAMMSIRNEAAVDFTVAWHGEPIGHLLHDGFEWRWTPVERKGPTLVRQTTPGKLPPFILSLLPEGWLESVLKDKDERAALRNGKRYMSNITIVERESELATLPGDVLLTPLERFSKDGLFTGTYAGPGRGEINEGFERNLARLFESSETPRLSGVQIKAPMYLDEKGMLTPSTAKPFTHILKPAGTSGFEGLPLVEWTALALGRAAGLDAPATALVSMPDGMPPALVVERFDIRRGANDTHMLALEDLCSVLDLPSSAKYDSTMERIVRAVRPLSTAPEDDVVIILKRALFAWLIADGDMHLKNLALLKIAEPGDDTFRSVRMAPLYDAVTTRVFPGLKQDHMALKLNGRDDRFHAKDFRTFARTARLKATDADAAIDSMLHQVGQAVGRISLPALAEYGSNGKQMTEQTLEIVRSRLNSFR